MHNVRSILILISLLLIDVTITAVAAQTTGKVVSVADGDTITLLLPGKQQEKVRLEGIDCPEKRQPFGTRAKQFTSKLVFGKEVSIKRYETDRYGRTIGRVYIDGKCLNKELLKAGLAWHYKKYSSDQEFAALEARARQQKIGVWGSQNAIAPWQFRNGGKSVATIKNNSPPADIENIIYHGNVRSRKFHKPSCRHYNCKNCVKEFTSREQAIRAGYEPCGTCKP